MGYTPAKEIDGSFIFEKINSGKGLIIVVAGTCKEIQGYPVTTNVIITRYPFTPRAVSALSFLIVWTIF